MKRLTILLFLFAFQFCVSHQNNTQKPQKQYELILRSAVSNFEIVFKSSPQKNDLVEQKVKFIMEQAIKGEIVFLIDINANNDLSAMGFNDYYNENRKPAIIIGTYFLDQYEKNPSVFYSALVHEFTHAYDYFNSQQYFVFYKNNRMVKALFEADAYSIESLFIENYLLPQQFKITKFETFLVEDFKNTNLSKIILINQIASIHLLHNFLQIRDSKESIENKTNALNTIGENLLEKFNSIPDIKDNEIKMEVISFYITYISMMDQLVYDIEQKESNTILDTEKFSLQKYKKLFQTKLSISEKIKMYEPEFKEYIIKENARIRVEI
ncbi:hypothetical protein EHQ94_17780 [Leptospira meyeri]|uniref:hypothetical protein n=1 Tax=Leptospira meyeri TaxID=29508 RepID=UPI001083C136|nr:hypothetical protein [Leptospira meyeri]TGM64441.1 hypothetical protein EHQ94_17780 [Leptospira meyeri]TGM67090.1 hypothetical protein EHQ93_03570 [Leptospira meyeri]